MTEQTTTKLKIGGLGAGVGAIIAMIIGFTWGGWVTDKTAMEMSDSAVLASRSEICVAQFMDAPDHEQLLKAFLDTNSWSRYQFVEKGGWDKMPGEETARTFVSGVCADGISAAVAK